MSEDLPPDTQPTGSLVPPVSHPPTAVGTAASPPPPPGHALARRRATRLSFGELVEKMLDTLDVVGDTIAHATGLRPRSGSTDG